MKRRIKVIALFIPFLFANLILHGVCSIPDYIQDTIEYWKRKEDF